MAEQPDNQPDSAEPDPQLNDQLDALLSDIDQAQSGGDAEAIADAEPAARSDQEPAAADESVDADDIETAELEGDFVAPDEDIVGSDLASQIQELLDDARDSHQEPGPALTDPADEDELPVDATFEAPAEPASETTAAAPRSSTDETTAAPVAGEAQDTSEIDQLDRELAEGADDAVSGDYETIEDVVASQGAAPFEEAGALAGLPDTVEAPTDEPSADEEGDSVGAAVAGGFSADAQAVARELDEQAQPVGVAAEPPERDGPTGAETSDAGATPGVGRGAVVAAPVMLRRTCAAINRPLMRVSPQTRDLVGYVGLLTLFNGVVFVVAQLLRQWMG